LRRRGCRCSTAPRPTWVLLWRASSKPTYTRGRSSHGLPPGHHCLGGGKQPSLLC
jgi:hypothetical protein